MIAVQHVAIHWTKADRGAAAGAVRKALPRALPFAPPGDARADWVHAVRYDALGDNRYGQQERWHRRSPQPGDGVRVLPRDGVAEVFLDPDALPLGKVRRDHLVGRIARLPFGQKLVLRVNGAADGDHQRLYCEHVFHIGFAGTATLALPTFRDIDETVLLY